MRLRKRLAHLGSNGRFWTWFWATGIALSLATIWPAVTIWAHSFVYVNTVSAIALALGCAAAWQASLSMRKADPQDPL
jgi:hypothetical protein